MNNELLELIADGESQTVEFKASFQKEVIETIVAFANTEGRTILVGLNDFGAPIGLKLGQEKIQNWLNQIKLSTSPAVIPDIEKIQIENVNKTGRFSLEENALTTLEKLQFIKNETPTMASMLLFVDAPLRMNIRVGRFKDDITILDDRQITDTLFEAVEESMKFIKTYLMLSYKFEKIPNGMQITFTKTTPQKTPQKTISRVRILELLSVSPKMTREKLSEEIGISADAVRQHIANLKQDGLLERVGGRKDGYWRVLDDSLGQ